MGKVTIGKPNEIFSAIISLRTHLPFSQAQPLDLQSTQFSLHIWERASYLSFFFFHVLFCSW
jgi:hypothetical protein